MKVFVFFFGIALGLVSGCAPAKRSLVSEDATQLPGPEVQPGSRDPGFVLSTWKEGGEIKGSENGESVNGGTVEAESWEDLYSLGTVFSQADVGPSYLTGQMLKWRLGGLQSVTGVSEILDSPVCAQASGSPEPRTWVSVCIGPREIKFFPSSSSYVWVFNRLEEIKVAALPSYLTAFIGDQQDQTIDASPAVHGSGSRLLLVHQSVMSVLIQQGTLVIGGGGDPGVDEGNVKPTSAGFETHQSSLLVKSVQSQRESAPKATQDGTDFVQTVQVGSQTDIILQNSVGMYLSNSSMVNQSFDMVERSSIGSHWFTLIQPAPDNPIHSFAHDLDILAPRSGAKTQVTLQSNGIQCSDLPNFMGFKLYGLFLEWDKREAPFQCQDLGTMDGKVQIQLSFEALKFQVTVRPVGFAHASVTTSQGKPVALNHHSQNGIQPPGLQTLLANPLHTGVRLVLLATPYQMADLPTSAEGRVWALVFDAPFQNHTPPNVDMKLAGYEVKPLGFHRVLQKHLYQSQRDINGGSGPFYGAMMVETLARLTSEIVFLRNKTLHPGGFDYVTQLQVPEIRGSLPLGFALNGLPFYNPPQVLHGNPSFMSDCGINMTFQNPQDSDPKPFYRYGLVMTNDAFLQSQVSQAVNSYTGHLMMGVWVSPLNVYFQLAPKSQTCVVPRARLESASPQNLTYPFHVDHGIGTRFEYTLDLQP
jgi:hypothetical protein